MIRQINGEKFVLVYSVQITASDLGNASGTAKYPKEASLLSSCTIPQTSATTPFGDRTLHHIDLTNSCNRSNLGLQHNWFASQISYFLIAVKISQNKIYSTGRYVCFL